MPPLNRLALAILACLSSLSLATASIEASSPSLSLIFPLTRVLKSVHISSSASAREGLGAEARRRLQAEVPIYGDYRQLAYYYADIFVGSNRQRFTVIADTGSSLTEVPCNDCGNCGSHMNPRYNPSASTSALAQLCPNCPGGRSCSNSAHPGQCTYSQAYAEGSQISGILFRDNVYLGYDGDATPNAPSAAYAIPFILGCGEVEGGLFNSQQADGIMGLGMGELSMTHALWSSSKILKKYFSLCLSFNGGAMTFGVVETRLHTVPIQWAALSATGFYVTSVNSWKLNGQINIDSNGFNSPHTIVDSGTTFTYVPSSAFRSLSSHISQYCAQAGKCVGTIRSVPGESLCYSINPPSNLQTFPSVSLYLGGYNGGAEVEVKIAAEHLFVNMGWDDGAYCLGVYDNGNGGGVIGGNAMMGRDIVFDLELSRIGFADSACVLDPSWIAEASVTATPSQTPSNTPSISDTGTSSTTMSATPSISTTATNGTSSFNAAGDTNKLPSVGALLTSPEASTAVTAIVVLTFAAALFFCFLRGCAVSIGGVHLSIQGRYPIPPTSASYARLGLQKPESANAAGPADTLQTGVTVRGGATAGSIGNTLVVEEEEDVRQEPKV